MLESRHPNVLFMVGFSLDDAPLLLTERAWGSVMAALRMAPLACETAVHVAAQVASALHFLHERSILHDYILIRNVLLLAPQESPRVTAKLANFGRAKLDVRDSKVLAEEVTVRVPCFRKFQ